MIKTRSIKENYEVCDLCKREVQSGLGTAIIHEDKLAFCNSRCQSYYYFPTKESYLEDLFSYENLEPVDEIDKKSSVASFTATGNKTGGKW